MCLSLLSFGNDLATKLDGWFYTGLLCEQSRVEVCDPHRTVNAKRQQHDEEHDGPEGGARQRWDGFRVDDEHQSRPCARTNMYNDAFIDAAWWNGADLQTFAAYF